MQTLITSLKLENAGRRTVNRRILRSFSKKDGYVTSFGNFNLNVQCTDNIKIAPEVV